MKNFRLATLACAALLIGAGMAMAQAVPEKSGAQRDVTFISTSDCHYAAYINEDRNERTRDTIKAINEVTNLEWPAALGGGKIDKPRGVVVLGDCIDDGDREFEGKNQSAKQYESFSKDFGLDGTDGLVKFTVFEGWGNHDGPPMGSQKHFSFRENLKKRNAIRKEKNLIGKLSPNGLHYAWDWDDVHFIQANLYPGEAKNRPDFKGKGGMWHDPEDSFAFTKDELDWAKTNGRPVVLLQHLDPRGVGNFWGQDEALREYNLLKDYDNLAVLIFGHSGTGIDSWAPKGETKKIALINDGQTENGFFVIQIKGDQMRYAYRGKKWTSEPGPNGKPTKKWTGEWEWRYARSVKITGGRLPD